MKKLFTKIGAITLGIALAAGAGVAMSMVAKDAVDVKAADYSLEYTLDGSITASGNAYATASTVTQNGIGWQVVGNTEQSPWRIGGKSISNVDRAIYSTTAMVADIKQIEVSSGATASSLSVNSLKISVHSTAADAASGSNEIASKTVTSDIASKTVTFEKTDSTSWAGKFYRIVYNVTRTGSSGNGYIAFNHAKFYIDSASSKTLNSISLSGEYPTEFYQGSAFSHQGMVVTAHFDDDSSADVTSSAEFSGYNMAVAGEQTVTVSYTFNETTKTAEYGINVLEVEMGTYQKVTTELTDYSGDYLLVYEGETQAYAFDGSLTTLDATQNTQAVTINDNTIVAAENYEFHIAAKTGGYSVKSSSGYYIGSTSYNNELKTSTTDDYTLTINLEIGISISYSETTYVVLKYNKTAGQDRFRFYKDTSTQPDIALYKKVTPTPAGTAEGFAQQLLDSTTDTCAAYVDGVTEYDAQKAALETIWTNLASEFAAANLDEVELAKLVNAEGDKEGTTIQKAMARYDFLCGKYALDQFITGRVINAAYFAPSNVATDSNMSIALIIIVTSVAVISTAAIVTLIVVRKKRFN